MSLPHCVFTVMALSVHWFHRPRGAPLLDVPRKFLFCPGATPGEFSTHYFGLGVVARGHKGRLARVGSDSHWDVAFICYARYIRPELLLFPVLSYFFSGPQK